MEEALGVALSCLGGSESRGRSRWEVARTRLKAGGRFGEHSELQGYFGWEGKY